MSQLNTSLPKRLTASGAFIDWLNRLRKCVEERTPLRQSNLRLRFGPNGFAYHPELKTVASTTRVLRRFNELEVTGISILGTRQYIEGTIVGTNQTARVWGGFTGTLPYRDATIVDPSRPLPQSGELVYSSNDSGVYYAHGAGQAAAVSPIIEVDLGSETVAYLIINYDIYPPYAIGERLTFWGIKNIPDPNDFPSQDAWADFVNDEVFLREAYKDLNVAGRRWRVTLQPIEVCKDGETHYVITRRDDITTGAYGGPI